MSQDLAADTTRRIRVIAAAAQQQQQQQQHPSARERYEGELIYTYVGAILVALNPFKV